MLRVRRDSRKLQTTESAPSRINSARSWRPTPQSSNTEEPFHKYRTQSSAYVDRPDIPVPCTPVQTSYLQAMQLSLHREHRQPNLNTLKHKVLPSIRVTEHGGSALSESHSSLGATSSQSSKSSKNMLHPLYQSQHHGKQMLKSRSGSLVQPNPQQLALFGSFSTKPRTDNSNLHLQRQSFSESQKGRKTRKQLALRSLKQSSRNDRDHVAMRLSFPCRAGCCYCVYNSLLGPVRVVFNRKAEQDKKTYLSEIRDGNGRRAIASSRKEDIRGLVYDPVNHSLHPPARGQRPVFQLKRSQEKMFRNSMK